MQTDELFLKGDELYEKGDFAGAFASFMQAAMKGDTSCMLRVAVMYTCGEGINCDYDKAIEWELKAAEAGETSALVNLGISFRIKGDIRKAKHWFERAIESGDGSGALALAKLYLVSPKEHERTIEYLNLAINSKNMCEDDIEEAVKILRELQT